MDITNFVISKRNEDLLIGDYGTYRKNLSRRILTLRRRLGRTSPKGRKYTTKTPISAEDVSSNPENVHLQLLLAERAWAHAMYMKSMHSAESDKPITGSTRTHVLSRLEKAKKLAKVLTELLSDSKAGATENALLEARAYYHMIEGSLQFEARRWKKCLGAYSIVHVVYSVLGQATSSKQSDVFRETLSSTVEPSIRYSAYQVSLPRTLPISKIVIQYAPKSSEAIKSALKLDPTALEDRKPDAKAQKGEGTGDLPRTITWRSRTVTIEDAAIAQSLASTYEAEERLTALLSSKPDLSSQEKALAYDQVLNPSQDAVDATRTAIDELVAEGASSADQRLQALQVTRTALNYALISWRIGRNRVLCGSADGAYLDLAERRRKRKPRKESKGAAVAEEGRGTRLARLRERVVLYDSTLQSIESIRELPGVAADRALGTELGSKKSYFSALRSLALARAHSLLDYPQNALALFAHSFSAASAISAADEPPLQNKPLGLEVTSSQSQALQQLLQGLVTQQRALVEIHNLHKKAVEVEKANKTGLVPFIDHLDKYPLGGVDLTQLVDYPPRLRPIPVKPIFLDVAFNYIDYPGRGKPKAPAEETEPKTVVATEEKKETKKGWGWFGR